MDLLFTSKAQIPPVFLPLPKMLTGRRSGYPLLGIHEKNGDSFLLPPYRLAEAGVGVAAAAARDNARAWPSVGQPALQEALHTGAQSGLPFIVIVPAFSI